jgi:hypothetical protein
MTLPRTPGNQSQASIHRSRLTSFTGRGSVGCGVEKTSHRLVQEINGRPDGRRDGGTGIRYGTVVYGFQFTSGLHLVREAQGLPLRTMLRLAEDLLVTHETSQDDRQLCLILVHFALVLLTSTVQGIPGQVDTRATESHAFRAAQAGSVSHGDASVSREKAAITRDVDRASVALDFGGKTKTVLGRSRRHRCSCPSIKGGHR